MSEKIASGSTPCEGLAAEMVSAELVGGPGVVRVKFVHAADLHLDAPFSGMREADELIGARLRDATLAAFDRVVEVCVAEHVHFAVFAGDIFISKDGSLRAQVRFRDGLGRLAEAGIPAFVAHGNHDPWGGWSSALEWPDLAHRFSPDEVESLPVTREGDTVCQVYGISFGRREATANLAGRFRRDDGAPYAVGVLHTEVGGRLGECPYAPCSVGDLAAVKLDYWALGHIHTREVIRAARPCIVYPGNTQGLDPTETGPRGCYVVTLDPGADPALDFRPTCAAEWRQERLQIEDLSGEQALVSAIEEIVHSAREEAGSDLVLLRLTLDGAGPLHTQASSAETRGDWLQTARDVAAGGTPAVRVESIQDRTRPAIDLETLGQGDDFVGEFLRLAEDAGGGETCDELREELASVLGRPEVEELGISPATLRGWFERAKSVGAERLRPGGDG